MALPTLAQSMSETNAVCIHCGLKVMTVTGGQGPTEIHLDGYRPCSAASRTVTLEVTPAFAGAIAYWFHESVGVDDIEHATGFDDLPGEALTALAEALGFESSTTPPTTGARQ